MSFKASKPIVQGRMLEALIEGDIAAIERDAGKALVIALNKAADVARTDGVKAIRKDINLNKNIVDKSLQVSKASYGNFTSKVFVTQRAITINKPTYGASYMRGEGVTFMQVHRGGNKTRDKWIMLNVKAKGYVALKRIKIPGKLTKRGKVASRLKVVYGISPDQVYDDVIYDEKYILNVTNVFVDSLISQMEASV